MYEERGISITHPDVALVFEGGAMRASYTSAVVKALIDAGMVFPKAYGTSAGAMLAACYISRNPMRAKATFVDSVRVKDAGGLGAFVKGEGFFNTQLIFEGLSEKNALDGNEWTFDFKAFKESPTGFHVEAFDRDSGATKAWEKTDMHTMTDVMLRIQASCAYPLFVNPAEVDGRFYADGGMGDSHDICIDAAMRDGFKRLFVVCTQPKGYRMPQVHEAKRLTYKVAYAKYPKLYDAILARPTEYNKLLDRLDELESKGVAYVFRPDEMPISYDTTDYEKLEAAYEAGVRQCTRDLPKWIDGLNRS